MEENDGNKKLTSCRAGHSHIHPCFCFLSVRKESWVKRMYSGSMRLTDQAFENSYENSSTPEFKALADLVKKQVRQPHLFFFFFFWNAVLPQKVVSHAFCSRLLQLKNLYSANPQLKKYYVGSTVQAFRYADMKTEPCHVSSVYLHSRLLLFSEGHRCSYVVTSVPTQLNVL